jgi:hypothetical protein
MSHRRTPFALLGLVAAALLLVLAPAAGARSRDANHDRIPDRWERAHHLSLKVDQARRDQDRDGLNNRGEFRAGDDPHRADSDRDGIEDGREDGGTIVSFADGTLTIKLFRNDKTVAGRVDDRSDIECEDHAASTRSGGDDGPGHDAGDDHGDEDASCGTAQLTPGTTVHEAKLSTTPDGLHFDEIELRSAATS